MKYNEYKISELIYKSISKTISEEEEAQLENWLSIPKNKDLFEKITNDQNIAQKIFIYKDIDVEKVFHKIEPHIVKKSKVSYLNILKYAAIFIVILASTFFYQQNTGNASKNQLEKVNAKIVLKIDDNTSKIIEEKGTEELKDKEGNILGILSGNQLTYKNQNTQKRLVYNTLIVPFGKRFELVLSDGTKVHLNAGTSLRYPANFIEGINREVFLNGEAFFDVAHDKMHPFIVNTKELDVQVLGTKFNVSSYTDEVSTDVTLVQGSVALDIATNANAKHKNSVLLKPGYKGSLANNSSKIGVQKVNTNLYTSWIHGELVLRNLPFKQIINRLERNYNVSIRNENKILDQEIFNASFKNQSIENILVYFSETHKIEYQIKNNEIIIQ